jgi:hypothetical protein
MCSTYAQSAVTHGDYYLEMRLGQLDPSCIGKGPTMKSVKCMGLEKGVE